MSIRPNSPVETVRLEDLGIDYNAVATGPDVRLPGGYSTLHLWRDSDEAKTALRQVASRPDLYAKSGQFLNQYSNWPTQLVTRADRVIGHVHHASAPAPTSKNQPNIEITLHTLRWLCALMQAAHSAGWVFGGLEGSVNFDSYGLPSHWTHTSSARHYADFPSASDYRTARAAELNELAELVTRSLGERNQHGELTFSSSLSPSQRGPLQLLAARSGLSLEHAPTALEWQIAMSGPAFLNGVMTRHRESTEDGQLELVVLVLPPTEHSDDAWSLRWLRLCSEIETRSRNLRLSAHVHDDAASQVLPYAVPARTTKPTWDIAQPLSDPAAFKVSLMRSMLEGTETFTMDGLQVTGLHILVPEELDHVDFDWSRMSRRRCSVSPHSMSTV